jgi:hypothetical protein
MDGRRKVGPTANVEHPIYTDLAIESMAMVEAVYGLAGCKAQGFIQSIFELMGLDLSAPYPRNAAIASSLVL